MESRQAEIGCISDDRGHCEAKGIHVARRMLATEQILPTSSLDYQVHPSKSQIVHRYVMANVSRYSGKIRALKSVGFLLRFKACLLFVPHSSGHASSLHPVSDASCKLLLSSLKA